MAENKIKPIKLPPRVKTPTILQMEGVECGAASLAIILGYYGRHVPLEKLRVACGVSRDGLKATNIMKAAREYGLITKGYSKSVEKLKETKLPSIIFWNFNHFLVLEGFTKNRVYLSDPAQGRYHVSHQEFDDSFTGVVMTFEPGPDFEKGNEKQGLLPALASRVSHSKMSVIFIVLASLFLVIPGLVVPSFTQIFIDKYLVNGMSGFVMPLLLAMGGILMINALLVFIQQYYLLRLETKLALTTSSQFLWHVFHLPIAFFTQRYSGEISNRVTLNDKVAKLLSGDLANAMLNVIVVIFYAILMFTYDVWLTAIGILVAALNVIALQVVSRARKDGNRRLLNESGKLMGATMSGISMIETLKASGREGDFFTTWSGHLAKVMNAQQELGWLTTRLNVVPPLLMSLNNTLIMGVGAMRVMDGQMTLGMLVAFLYLMSNFIRPINQLVGAGRLLQETEGDMNRIDDVLNYDISEEFKKPAAAVNGNGNTYTDGYSKGSLNGNGNGHSKGQGNGHANGNGSDAQLPYRHFIEPTLLPHKLAGRLELRNVSFGYTPTMPPLIEDFSIRLEPGSRVALVGGSGSGKSTVARLVAGLYEPWEGEILLDGRNRRDIPRHMIHSSLAVIDQEILMFKGTIKENIAFWDPTMSEHNIIQSAKDATIHEVIAARTNAYDSEVAERGTNFSGGQRQRLEISRALALNPTLLVMDEATSALDPKSEKVVMDNIRRRGCTCLIVAHRLSTIRDCDEIIVMKFGKIAERGTHEELIARNGLYAELITAK
jgi:NHLM bacteriocin system ABC transporter peptidase/ATP-binding protein